MNYWSYPAEVIAIWFITEINVRVFQVRNISANPKWSFKSTKWLQKGRQSKQFFVFQAEGKIPHENCNKLYFSSAKGIFSSTEKAVYIPDYNELPLPLNPGKPL